jgi:hypothetical protein
MAKGRRDRATEEDLVSRAIVLSLTRACGIVGKVGFGAAGPIPRANAERLLWVDCCPSLEVAPKPDFPSFATEQGGSTP